MIKKFKKKYDELVFGYHAVLSSMQYMSIRAKKLYLQESLKKNKELIFLAKKKNIFFQIVTKKFLNNLLNIEVSHQGIILLTKPYPYQKLNDILKKSNKQCLVLSEIQDPRNLGRIARTAWAFFVDFIIISKNKCAQVSGIAEKTASGALSKIPIVRVNSISYSLSVLKLSKFWILGAVCGKYKTFWNFNIKKKIALVVGNESKGIKSSILKRCDDLVNIPMRDDVNSLNVSDCSTIMLYEILKKRALI